MSTLKEKVMMHPLVILIGLIAIGTAGLAAFTDNLTKVAKAAKCIPIHLGLDDGYQGS